MKKFEVEVGGRKVALAVIRPSLADERQATKVYDRAYRQAVSTGSLTREQISHEYAKAGLWDKDKARKSESLLASVLDGEKKLSDQTMKPEEGRDIARKLRQDRQDLLSLVGEVNERYATSAEAAATQARFEYLVAVCTVHPETRKTYFRSVEDYRVRADSPDAEAAATAIGQLLYGVEKDLPENRYLRLHGE